MIKSDSIGLDLSAQCYASPDMVVEDSSSLDRINQDQYHCPDLRKRKKQGVVRSTVSMCHLPLKARTLP